MTEEEIKKGKEKYQKLFNEKMEALELEEKINRLLKNPYVKKYLKLVQMKNLLIDTNCNVEALSFDTLATDTKKSNEIFVYVGKSPMFINAITQYYYRDLETGNLITITKNEISDFEKNNLNVIYPFGNINIEDYSNNDYNTAYEILRDKFFESILIDDQGKSIEKIKKIKFTRKDKK